MPASTARRESGLRITRFEFFFNLILFNEEKAVSVAEK